jgi:hypothetical protein
MLACGLIGGCADVEQSSDNVEVHQDNLIGYSADSLEIIGLTAVKIDPADKSDSDIEVYINLSDAFDSDMKYPGLFRFELYQFVPRSSQAKGSRVHVWSDVDLNDAIENNRYWHDHLRAYKFVLDMDFNPYDKRTYVLQVTCITPDGKRLGDEVSLGNQR